MMELTALTNVGLIGAGVISTNMHIPVLRAMQSVKIKWIADANQKCAEEVGRANRLATVALDGDLGKLPKVDIVLLAIPLPPRGGYFDFFADSKTTIFAEKPLAVSATLHRQIMNCYEPWRLAVGYQRRYFSTYLLLRKLIRSNIFGGLQKIVVSEGGRVTKTGATGGYQDVPAKLGGGIIKNLGCHSIDLAFWITGATDARIQNRIIQWDDDTDRGCAADVKLLNVNGAPGLDCDLSLELSWLQAQLNTINFHFENVQISCPVSPVSDLQLRDVKGNFLAAIDARLAGGALTSYQAFYLEWKDVLGSVQSQIDQPNSAKSSLITAELIDELLER